MPRQLQTTIGRKIKFCSGELLRQKLLVNDCLSIAMGILVAFAVFELFHKGGRSIADMERNRQ